MAGDNRFVTEYFLAQNFTPKSGVTPGSDNTLWMDCDQILARYNVSISGVTTTGKRWPSQNQITSLSSSTTVTINPVYSIGSVTAYTDASVSSSLTITARGVCWSTSANPTISGSKTTNGSGAGSFQANITGLTANTTYYVRAYATDSNGVTTYSNQESFQTKLITVACQFHIVLNNSNFDGLWTHNKSYAFGVGNGGAYVQTLLKTAQPSAFDKITGDSSSWWLAKEGDNVRLEVTAGTPASPYKTPGIAFNITRHKMWYLLSNIEYNSTQIATIMANATSLSLSVVGSQIVTDQFTMHFNEYPSSTYLYLIWDYRE